MAIGQKALPPGRSSEGGGGGGDEASSLRYSQRNDPDSAPPPYAPSSSTFPPQRQQTRMGNPSSDSAPLIANSTNNNNDVERDWYEEHRRSHQQGRRRRRIARIFIVVALLIVIILTMTSWSSSGRNNDDNSPTTPPAPPSRDGSPRHRPHWSPPTKQPDYGRGGDSHDWYSTVTNFTLDFEPDFDSVWLHAEGISYRGYLTVAADGRLKDGQASVGVETIFPDESQRDHAVWVGQMSRGSKDVGVGIYGHRNGQRWRDPQVEVRIHLFLPAQSTTPLLPPLEIKVDAISTSWDVAPEHLIFPKKLRFQSDAGSIQAGVISARDSVSLKLDAGSIRPIASSSANITSKEVDIRLDAGSVSLSTLTAYEHASIRTNAGSIRFHDLLSAPVARVSSDAGSIEGTYEVIDELKVEASAGHIAINVKLPAGDANGSNHTARVRAHSDAGGVRLRYLEHDKSVTLDSHATSSTGSVEVKHHPNFEGRVDLETSFGRLDITPPSDGAREWLVESDRKGWTGRHVVGQVKGKKGNVGAAVCKADTGSVNAIF